MNAVLGINLMTLPKNTQSIVKQKGQSFGVYLASEKEQGKNEAEKNVTSQVAQKCLEDLLSKLGFSADDKKALLEIIQKLNIKPKKQSDQTLAELVSALQTVVQAQPNDHADQKEQLDSTLTIQLKVLNVFEKQLTHLVEDNNKMLEQSEGLLSKLVNMIDGKLLDNKSPSNDTEINTNDSTVLNQSIDHQAQMDVEKLLSNLGLSSENKQVYLKFFQKIAGLSQSDRVQLFTNLQKLIQQPTNLKDSLNQLTDPINAQIQSLLQSSSLEDGQDIKLASFILLENIDQNTFTKLDNTKKYLFANQLKDGLSQLIQQKDKSVGQTNHLISKLISVIDEKVSSHTSTTSAFPKLSRNEYLLTLYNRNFNQSLNQDGESQAENKLAGTTNSAGNKITVDSQHSVNLVNSQQILPMTKTQQFVLFAGQSLDQAAPNQDSFIKNFENILAKSQFSMTNGTAKLVIKLYPEHLGSIQVELIHQDNAVIARILTSTASAKDMLESQIQNLKHAFQAQNIPVEKLDISSQLQQSFERPFYQEGNPEQQSQQQQPRKQQENNKQGEVGLGIDSFKEELLNFQV